MSYGRAVCRTDEYDCCVQQNHILIAMMSVCNKPDQNPYDENDDDDDAEHCPIGPVDPVARSYTSYAQQRPNDSST